jgi:hypothetical protein
MNLESSDHDHQFSDLYLDRPQEDLNISGSNYDDALQGIQALSFQDGEQNNQNNDQVAANSYDCSKFLDISAKLFVNSRYQVL